MTLVEKLKSECVCGIDIAFAIGECTEEEFESSRDYLEGFKNCRERAIKIVENYDPWIPVSSGNLPCLGEKAWTCEKNKDVKICTYRGTRHNGEPWWDAGNYNANVIAWQPLPKPYKVE